MCLQKGEWLHNGTCGRRKFGVIRCARLQRKKSWKGAVRSSRVADLSRKTSRRGGFHPHPPLPPPSLLRVKLKCSSFKSTLKQIQRNLSNQNPQQNMINAKCTVFISSYESLFLNGLYASYTCKSVNLCSTKHYSVMVNVSVLSTSDEKVVGLNPTRSWCSSWPYRQDTVWVCVHNFLFWPRCSKCIPGRNFFFVMLECR